MSHSDRPVLLSQSTVTKLTNNPEFFNKFPEFRQLKQYVNQAGVVKASGCRSCRKRRAEYNVMVVFIQILSQCSEQVRQRLKDFLGVPALQYHGYNPVTRSYECKQI